MCIQGSFISVQGSIAHFIVALNNTSSCDIFFKWAFVVKVHDNSRLDYPSVLWRNQNISQLRCPRLTGVHDRKQSGLPPSLRDDQLWRFQLPSPPGRTSVPDRWGLASLTQSLKSERHTCSYTVITVKHQWYWGLLWTSITNGCWFFEGRVLLCTHTNTHTFTVCLFKQRDPPAR